MRKKDKNGYFDWIYEDESQTSEYQMVVSKNVFNNVNLNVYNAKLDQVFFAYLLPFVPDFTFIENFLEYQFNWYDADKTQWLNHIAFIIKNNRFKREPLYFVDINEKHTQQFFDLANEWIQSKREQLFEEQFFKTTRSNKAIRKIKEVPRFKLAPNFPVHQFVLNLCKENIFPKSEENNIISILMGRSLPSKPIKVRAYAVTIGYLFQQIKMNNTKDDLSYLLSTYFEFYNEDGGFSKASCSSMRNALKPSNNPASRLYIKDFIK